MPNMNDFGELRVTMERVAGDIRLISERQVQHKEDMKDIKQRINENSKRISILEAERAMRKGAIAMWSALSGVAAAVAGIFAKTMGWI